MKRNFVRWVGSTNVGLVSLALMSLVSCKKEEWIEGKWLYVNEQGKLAGCYRFAEKRALSVYSNPECSGTPDEMASGKWQLKAENQLALQRGTEHAAKLAVVLNRSTEQFSVRGALSGSLHSLKQQNAAHWIGALQQNGTIKIKELPAKLGCEQLSLSVDRVRKLPKDDQPGMLRAADQVLAFYGEPYAGNPALKKVVYALNQDQIEWVNFHYTASAFQELGPAAQIEKLLGPPEHTVTMGQGELQQQIMMWRAFCDELRGAIYQDVDATLVITPKKQLAYLFVSTNIISDSWENLRRAALEEEATKAAPAPSSSTAPTNDRAKSNSESTEPSQKTPSSDDEI